VRERRFARSENLWRSLSHDRDAILNAVFSGAGTQSLNRLFQWLVTEAKAPVVHRHHPSSAEILKSLNRFLGIHVHVAAGRWVVCPDGKQGDVDFVARANLSETIEVRGVSTVKDRPPGCFDDESPKSTVRVVQHPGAPMVTRRERNVQRPMLVSLPVVQLVNAPKAEVVNEVPDVKWYNDRLIGGDAAERSTIKVIKMRVGHEDEIDRGQVVQVEPGMPMRLMTFSHFAQFGSISRL
jgi:hypothetical protein